MSGVPPYPEPKYLGETGEASAVLGRADDHYDLQMDEGARLRFLATGADTAGEFGVHLVRFTGRSPGAIPHFHRTHSEYFYVLLGTVQVFDGNGWTDAGPGDFMLIPEGAIHGFRHESEEPALMLLMYAPGAPREDFYRGFAEWTSGHAPSPEEAAAFMRSHDNNMVRPPSP